ncbi:hypothetical protein IGI37_002648 [Enterococcus sp. AZ194]|uniref:cell wall synthase accessory phosphoprotein MacP n=1 Tax=Enterococcus sp. AZ194 TaxID=2774629 RepID=UPI003F28BC6A
MSKGPLVTRSELRKRREEEADLSEKQIKQQLKQTNKDYDRQEKEISSFYRKEQKKAKAITKTRAGEQIKMRERNKFLNKSLLIVAVLLIIVVLMVIYL